MTLSTDAATRKAIPLTTGVLDYFPDALAAVAECSKKGNDQHNPGQPLHWARDKSTDHADCIGRHLIERGTVDVDGIRHAAKLAWRALALLQTEIEAEQRTVGKSPLLAAPYGGQRVKPATMLYNCGDPIPVVQKPGESIHEAICRTTREAHGLPRMQEQGDAPALETKFGFTVGETVNTTWCEVGYIPGKVVGFDANRVELIWRNNTKSSRYWPNELRHGE